MKEKNDKTGKSNKSKKKGIVLGALFLMCSLIALANFATATLGVFPNPFVNGASADFAIVYGSGTGANDATSAGNIGNYFKTTYDSNRNQTTIVVTTGNFTSSGGVTEREIELGSDIANNGDIDAVLTDNDIPSLFDGHIEWDDGIETDNYNVHEEIVISTSPNAMKVITSIDDNDLEDFALTNDEALEYRYVFEETLNTSLIGDDDADNLNIVFLGEKLTISEVSDDEVTFTKGVNEWINEGEVKTINGATIELLSVSDDEEVDIIVNGVRDIIEEGKVKKLGGIEIELDNAFYTSCETCVRKAKVTIAEDVEYTIEDGDAYIGEDEDDPEWVWSVESPCTADGYIGVRYNERQQDSDDDVISVRGAYIFPRNFAQVNFIGTTNVDYEEVTISFDEMDLYGATQDEGEIRNNAKVMSLKADLDDAFEVGNEETDSIYFFYDNENTTAFLNVTGGWENISSPRVEVYHKDVSGDISDGKKVRYLTAFNKSEVTSVGTLIIGDTELEMVLDYDNGVLSLGNINISFGGNNTFKYLGNEDENAESDELIADGSNIGSEEEDVVDHYGIIFEKPESNGDNDEVVMQIPDEQVYAEIGVFGSDGEFSYSGSQSSVGSDLFLDSLIVKDTEVSNVLDKNLIVVGGPCINAYAAQLLGVTYPSCGEAFTKATGTTPGNYLFQTFTSPNNVNKTISLIAGYEKEDTDRGVENLLLGVHSADSGQKNIVG